MIKKGGFLLSNWAYLIWFAFYFTISVLFIMMFTKVIEEAIIFTAVSYLITLAIALSPIGEFIIRVKLGIKGIVTAQDIEKLSPIFNEVYQTVLEVAPNISRSIKLYIIDDYSINALAVGRNTIALTLGAVHGLNDFDLKGLLAHEFGHIAYGDTKSLLLASVGNGFFIVIIKILDITQKVLTAIFSLFQNAWAIVWFIKLIVFLLNIAIKIFYGISAIILSLNSRASEYLADSFAVRAGYGFNLIDVLYIINQVHPDGVQGIKGNLTKSHPYLTDRIARLESIVNSR